MQKWRWGRWSARRVGALKGFEPRKTWSEPSFSKSAVGQALQLSRRREMLVCVGVVAPKREGPWETLQTGNLSDISFGGGDRQSEG